MKFFTLLFVAVSLFVGGASAKENPFLGTWQLVSGEYVDEQGKLVNYQSLGIRSQKVISDKHFSFVSMTNGKFWAAGTGTYQFSDTEYSEQPTMASFPMEDSGNYVFAYEIKGTYWHNSRWRGDKRVEYEVWRKIN